MSPRAARIQGWFAAEQVGQAGWLDPGSCGPHQCHFRRVTLPAPGWQDSQGGQDVAERPALPVVAELSCVLQTQWSERFPEKRNRGSDARWSE